MNNALATYHRFASRLRLPAVCLCAFLFAMGAFAQDDQTKGGKKGPEKQRDPKQEEIQREVQFATALVNERLSGYAKKVIDKLLLKYPDAEPMTKAVGVRMLCANGKFEDAEAEVAKMPANSHEALEMKLAIADMYYNQNKLKEARRIYNEFFTKYQKSPTPQMQQFFNEAAYRFAQMLAHAGDEQGAVEAYKRLIGAPGLEEDLVRLVKTEMAELCVKAVQKNPAGAANSQGLLKEAWKLCEDIQWRDFDLWSAKSVSIMAHVLILQGKKKEANKLITDYMPLLKQVDEELRKSKHPMMRFSPMAECIFLQATLHEEEGRRLMGQKDGRAEGVKHMMAALDRLKVLLTLYASSSWAMEAWKHGDGIVRTLKAEGITPPDLPGLTDRRFIEAQFQEARLLFQDQKYEEATDRFAEVLSVYRDRPGTVTPLAELAQYFFDSKQDKDYLCTRAVAGYVAERFCKNTNLCEEAGDTLLSIGRMFERNGAIARWEDTLDLFFTKFPKHSQASGMLMYQGDTAFRATNWVLALKYYRHFADTYPQARSHSDALSRAAYCYSTLDDHTNSVTCLTTLVAKLPAGMEQVTARLRLAEEHRAGGQLLSAVAEYTRIVSMLSPPQGEGVGGPGDKNRKRDILEQASLNVAACYSRIKTPAERIPTYQTNAVICYQTFLKAFPGSKLAPKALGAMGTLLYIQNRAEEANAAFKELRERYPESAEAENVVFVQAETLLSMGRTNDAIQVFADMLKKPDAYTSPQFLKGGRLMFGVSQYEQASKMFALARNTTNDANWQAASVALGQAFAGLRDWPQAIKPIEELLAKHEHTGYKMEVSMVLGLAYAHVATKEADPKKALDLYNKAIRAMNDVNRLAKDTGDKANSDMQLASIQMLMGKKSEAAATYLRFLLFSDVSDPKVRPYIEDAFEAGVPLLIELKSKEVAECCETYLKSFPSGRSVDRAREWLGKAKSDLTPQIPPS